MRIWMNPNLELQKDVQNAIEWEPSMNNSTIAVSVSDGIVTLCGMVDSYAKKIEAENAAKSVLGVKAIIEYISINYGKSFIIKDADIVKDVMDTWNSDLSIPEKKVVVKVERGWLTLEGTVDWNSQREAAERTLVNLSGIKGINNQIVVKSNSNDSIEQTDIVQALKRSWAINSLDIKIDIKESIVKLTGMVHSLYQKEEAGRLTWNAPGVSMVENELEVIY